MLYICDGNVLCNIYHILNGVIHKETTVMWQFIHDLMVDNKDMSTNYKGLIYFLGRLDKYH